MSDGYLLGQRPADYLARAMEREGVDQASDIGHQASGNRRNDTLPFEITEDWEKRDGENVYSCRGVLITFDGADYQVDKNSFPFPIYSPLDLDEKPALAVGDRCSAVLRGGRWEIVGGGLGELGGILNGIPLCNIQVLQRKAHLLSRVNLTASDPLTTTGGRGSFSIIPGKRDIVVVTHNWNGYRIPPTSAVTYAETSIKIQESGNSQLPELYKVFLNANAASPTPALTIRSGYTASVTEPSSGNSNYTINYTNYQDSSSPVVERYNWRFALPTTYSDAATFSPGTVNIPDVLYMYATNGQAMATNRTTGGILYNPFRNATHIWGAAIGAANALLKAETPGGMNDQNPVDITSLVDGSTLKLPVKQNTMPTLTQQAFNDLFEMKGGLTYTTSPPTAWQAATQNPLTVNLTANVITRERPFQIFAQLDTLSLKRVGFRASLGWYVIH